MGSDQDILEQVSDALGDDFTVAAVAVTPAGKRRVVRTNPRYKATYDETFGLPGLARYCRDAIHANADRIQGRAH